MNKMIRWLLCMAVVCVCMLGCAAEEQQQEILMYDLESRAAHMEVCTSKNAYCDAPNICMLCGREHEGLIYISHHEIYVDIGEVHQVECSACDYVGKTDIHRGRCDNPSVCYKCSKVITPEPAYKQEHIEERYVYLDDTYHQRVCDACGYEDTPSRHAILCDEPGVCFVCNSTHLSLAPDCHPNVWISWVDLGEMHQQVCNNCDYAWEAGYHWGDCETPRLCLVCENNDAGIRPDYLYHGDMFYQNMGDYHIETCKSCGYSNGSHYGHVVYCTAPMTCIYCEADGLNASQNAIKHNLTIVDLGDEHQNVCEDCGYSTTEPHEGFCDDPNYCVGCGLRVNTILPENLIHFKSAPYTIQGDKHVYTCQRCQQIAVEDHFPKVFDEPCFYCGYVTASTGIAGDADSDAHITEKDALKIMEVLSGKVSEFSFLNADVNNDERIDNNDILLILQYVSGWDVTLE